MKEEELMAIKIALVTGASRGIGAATAIQLARQGCDVVVNYLSRAEAAQAVVRQIESLGRRALAVQADVSDYAQVQRMIEMTVRALGGLQILVNNAGYSSHAGIEQLSLDEWRRMLAVTLDGAFYCAKLAVPHLRAAGWGRIVNVISLRALTGSAHSPHYATAKAGLIGLTKSLALELAPYNITVNAVAPGYTDTEMNRKSLAERGDQIRASIPLKRIATPDEIASVIAFLCSEEAGYITGETIGVTGGLYMR
jgi:3-oxoacyl-[acyl-carrier protein] reductase